MPAQPAHASTPSVRLTRPVEPETTPIQLDPSQAAALAAARVEPALLVVGAAGTGKTLLAERIAQAAVRDWGVPVERILVIAPTRRAASELRTRVSQATGATASVPLVRTAASVAISILTDWAAAQTMPVPTLITGPEQDRDIADLLDAYLADRASTDEPDSRAPLPPGLSPEVLATEGFRHELRDLFMRVAEWGLSANDLVALGMENARPEWIFAGGLYREYHQIIRLQAQSVAGRNRLDPGILVAEAARVLSQWPRALPKTPAPGFDLVVVDDYQEATLATAGLLEAFRANGTRLVLLGNVDAAVQTFRGASPMLLGRAESRPGSDIGAFGATAMVLGTNWRQPPELAEVTVRIVEQIPTLGGPIHRYPGCAQKCETSAGAAESEADTVQVVTLGTQAEEAAWIARQLRTEHLLRGTPWHRMAVITRTRTQLAALRRELASAGIPVRSLGTTIPLRSEPAVAPLLSVYRACLQPEYLTADVAARLLISPLIGLDTLGLRRLRRELRTARPELTSDESLLLALGAESAADGGEPTPAALGQLAAIVNIGRRAAASEGATAQTLLWAIWAATGLSEKWQQAAVVGGSLGARADHDLDTVVALFKCAEVFVERNPGAPPEAFLEFLEAQDLPADNLAQAASGVSAVAAVTAAAAAGTEWDVVVVQGVQDGVWPNLRLRDSILGAVWLTELLAGRTKKNLGVTDGGGGQGRLDIQAARKQILADELRAFAVATSRARRRLIVTAVANSEEQPSGFLNLVADPVPLTAGHTLDLSGVVSEARSILLSELRASQEASAESDAAASAAQTERIFAVAALLAELADAGISAADPANWYGVALPSSTEPLWPADAQVPIWASQLELITKCPLRWAFQQAGARAVTETTQQLGTLIHSIAQHRPNGTHAELAADLAERWPELGLPHNWLEQRTRERAEAMIARLARYIADNPDHLMVEDSFSVDIDRAKLIGKFDRLDRVKLDSGETGVRVTDFKTSANPISLSEQQTNPQLIAYQLGVNNSAKLQKRLTEKAGGPVVNAGAQLVYLGAGANGPTVRSQTALVNGPGADADEPGKGVNWARALVNDAACAIAGANLLAQETDWCRHCPVANSCPLRTERV